MRCDRGMDSIEKKDSVFLKSDNCVVDWTATFLQQVRKESCGKDVFCREGLSQLHKMVQDISGGRGESDDVEMMLEICHTIALASDCDLSKSAAATMAAAVEEFREEWDAHIKRKKCPAVVCSQLVTFHILGDKCTGCTQCRDHCPEGAIVGDQGMIHVIDQDKCTKCGKCLDVCCSLAGAVVKAGAVKPQTPEKPEPVGSWQPNGTGLGLKKGLGLRKNAGQ